MNRVLNRFHVRCVFTSLLRTSILCFTGVSAASPILVGMGDSVGEGVQSADAARQTQVFSYINWVNHQMGADLTLPLIETNFFGMVGDTNGRSRIVPESINTNIAVSGTTLHSLLNDRPNALTPGQIDSEIDLVSFPGLLSQIEFVEASPPQIIVCWIGKNDVLSAAISFGNMDASQLTPVLDFRHDYRELVDRLGTLAANHGTRVVFANIPDITKLGFLANRTAAEAFLGFPVALPEGHYTSLIGLIMMKIAGNDNLVGDPNFVLDDVEVALIQDRILTFNRVIRNKAKRIGMPVVDVYTLFNELTANPPVFAGLPIRKSILGGLFSLDGIHPSNIGSAILANAFIQTMNQAFAMNIPEISQDVLNVLTLTEPALDKDQDGRATGRPGVGLVETLAFLFGLTGDPDDFTPN